MLPGIVLAAGNSVRMGSPKALLHAADGQPFVARVVATLRMSGIRDLVVVTGRDHEAIVSALETAHLEGAVVVARNPDPDRGQLSSLWTGMDVFAESDLEGILVTLVDVPMIAAATVVSVVDAWRHSRAPIVRPATGDRHGHPVIFDRAVLESLRRASLAEGAKSIIRANEARILNVPVEDEGCLVDVDTREDYRRMSTVTSHAPPLEPH